MTKGKIDVNSCKQKEGSIQIYEKSCCGGDWNERHFVLYNDSRLTWFKDKDSHSPIGTILLRNVVQYICVGLMTDKMPGKKPDLPKDASRHLLVGIGIDQNASKVYWLLFKTASDIESWFVEIGKTLPPPPQQPPPPSEAPHQQPGNNPDFPRQQQINNGKSGPPPAYPSVNGNYQPGNGGYFPQPVGSTVIVQQPGFGGGYGGGDDRMLTGLLLGSMVGYGMGSFWGGPMGFYGPMGGFGGGYYSNNDTTTVNNYYEGNDPNGQQPAGGDAAAGAGPVDGGEAAAGGDTQAGADGENYDNDGGYDQGDYGGYENGGGYDQGDYGGYDNGGYGGGDYGGGNYGDGGGYDYGGGGDFGGGGYDFGGGDFGGGGGDFGGGF
ncbi:unnamed protein product, partial [Mesorhabditis belari]|uniref:PH domain-containing protein n=1 Tax=Mesorhabditis belari TaxID=2138241 RepID=A0AAF3EA75_9BILA